MSPEVRQVLLALAAQDPMRWVENDPVRFVCRYASVRDREVAAVVASCLAFGRVDLFGPVIERVLGVCGEYGGPGAFVVGFDEGRGERLRGVMYRWHKDQDFIDLFWTLRRILEGHGSIGALFVPGKPQKELLGTGVRGILACKPEKTSSFFTRFFPSPEDGSACKRLAMMVRWMVRRGAPDLGVWEHLSPAELVIPIDVHTGRIARFLGLTARTDASWKTAEVVTAALRELDPQDPVRFDFALAHVGISDGCKGYKVDTVCGGCALKSVCVAPLRPEPTGSRR